MVLWISVLKPFVYLWAGLNALDDVSILVRIGRLGIASFRGGGREDLCEVCDDVMGELLSTDGITVLPCELLCLRVPSCVEMCHRVQEASEKSSKYPCIAAGYCDDHLIESAPECRGGPLFSCRPQRFCRRKRRRLTWSCELRPGIGRWLGIKNSMRREAGALVQGLVSQPHCGEEGAGPYCIAKPRGSGALAEILGFALSILYGGYRSVVALESPGGDDDQQWLTFWLILMIILFVERFFVRILLSKFRFYYEARLGVLVWLISFHGAEKTYRRFRKFLVAKNLLPHPDQRASIELATMQETGKALIANRMSHIRRQSIVVRRQSLHLKSLHKIDYLEVHDQAPTSEREGGDGAGWRRRGWCREAQWHGGGGVDAAGAAADVAEYEAPCAEKMQNLCEFLLSADGTQAMRESVSPVDRADLLEKAAAYLSFQPRFLSVHLVGVTDGPAGTLPAPVPPQDTHGLADPYVVCRLDPGPGAAVSSRIDYRTLRPHWNETLELPLAGGRICANGWYRNDAAASVSLRLEVWDRNVGFWGFVLRVVPAVATAAAVGSVVTYIFSDSSEVGGLSRVTMMVGMLLFSLSYVMVVVKKADQVPIGKCEVPLALLMDQGTHTLHLTLRELAQKGKEGGVGAEGGPRPTNAVGGLGTLRVALSLSER